MATTKETVRCNVIQNKKLAHLQSELQKKFLLKMDCCNGKSQLCLINCDGTLRKNGNISFFNGSTPFREGAIATTRAHDHHNLMVMGNTIEDILLAQNELLAMQGGYLVASDQQVMATCPLPIGGILSQAPIDQLGASLQKSDKLCKR